MQWGQFDQVFSMRFKLSLASNRGTTQLKNDDTAPSHSWMNAGRIGAAVGHTAMLSNICAAALAFIPMWPYIAGAVAASPRSEVVLDSTSNGAIISGDLKLVFGTQKISFWQGPVYPNATCPKGANSPTFDCGRGCLFNVTADPSEHDDLARPRCTCRRKPRRMTRRAAPKRPSSEATSAHTTNLASREQLCVKFPR